MATVKEQKHPYIIKNKDMQGGKAIIKGTRVPVSTDGEQLKYAISRGAVLLTPAQHSRNQEDKASGVWQVAGDVLLVTRHPTHVTSPFTRGQDFQKLTKLVLMKLVLV